MSRRHAALIVGLGVLLMLPSLLRQHDDTVVRAEPTTIMFAVGLAMSALSAYLSYKRNKSVLKDDNPNSTAERGAWIPVVIGRRRLGAVVLYVEGALAGGGGGAFGPGTPSTGGKRGGGTKPFRTKVAHGLCLGPVARIRRIWMNGKIVATGDINPDNTPSGASVTIGTSTMRVYWGERDQPVDAVLSAAFPFASRWPFLCWVMWDTLDLGTIPQHPIIEYEVEAHPYGSQLKESPGWYVGPAFDPGTGGNVATINVVSPVPQPNEFRVNGDLTSLFKSQTIVRLSGTYATSIFGEAQVYCDVLSSVYEPFPRLYTSVFVGGKTTRPIVNGITQVGDFAAVCPFDDDDGVNPAHALYQVLFAPWPHGRSLDVSKYDVQSLETVGIMLHFNEAAHGDILIKDGETAEAIVAQICQDFSIAISMNPESGLQTFYPIRAPIEDRQVVNKKLLLPPRPEVETLLGSQPSNQIVFKFSDRVYNYRDMTIVANDDADIWQHRAQRDREVQITSTTLWRTARELAYRRAQEELANQTKIRFFGHRDVRYLMAGLEFDLYGFPFVMRLLSNKPDMVSGKTECISYVDKLGVPAASNQDELEEVQDSSGGYPEEPNIAVEDAAVALFEMPRMYEDEKIKLLVFRARASEEIDGAWIWISDDDTNYIRVAYTDITHAAVTITATVPDTSSTTTVEGDEVGVDVAATVDLSGNEASWRLGRQIGVVVDSLELMYVRSTTAVGGGSFTLDDCLRGRLGTTIEAHAVDDVMFVAESHRLITVESPLLQPGRTIYVKVQPTTASNGEVSLDSVGSRSILIQGLAWKPLTPVNLQTWNRSDSRHAGEDLRLLWRYYSTEWPKTGAGMQGAGDPTSTPGPVQGEFVVTLHSGPGINPPLASFNTRSPELIVDFDTLFSVYGDTDPDNVYVEVRHVFAGRTSGFALLTVEKI